MKWTGLPACVKHGGKHVGPYLHHTMTMCMHVQNTGQGGLVLKVTGFQGVAQQLMGEVLSALKGERCVGVFEDKQGIRIMDRGTHGFWVVST